MMTGLKKSLIYWGRSIEKFFLFVLLISVITVGCMSVLYGEIDYGYIFFYVPMILSISIIAIAYTNITTSLSNTIALGATRRDSFWGMEIFFHLLVLQGMIITGIVLWLLPEVYKADKVTLGKYIVALYILSCAFGNVINVVVMRCGMKMAKGVYIAVDIVICVLAILVLQISEYIVIPFLGTVSMVAAGIGMVLDIVSIMMCNRAVREYEVRV